MKLFRSGGTKAATQPSSQMNPLLQGFWDSDSDGGVDLSDVLKQAGSYLAK